MLLRKIPTVLKCHFIEKIIGIDLDFGKVTGILDFLD